MVLQSSLDEAKGCAVRGTDTADGRNGLRIDWKMVILDDAMYEESRSKVERVEELDASCLMHTRLLSLPSCWTSAGVSPPEIFRNVL